MKEFTINPDVDYPRIARNILSNDKKLLSVTFERIRSDKNLPNVFKINEGHNTLYSTRINLDEKDGFGYWEFLQLSDDLFVIAVDCQYPQTHTETVLGEGFLEFHFKVSGELLMEWKNGKKLSVRGPSLLIWKQPGGHEITEWTRGGAWESSLTLYCKPKLFTDRFKNLSKNFPPIIKSFICGSNDHIEFEVIPLNPALAFSITNLLRSNFSEDIHLEHTKAKSYDLLCDILQYLCSPNLLNENDAKPLTTYEKQRLQEARDILSTTFNPPLRIRELAKKIGLNETKFKKGFKRLFGSTIYEYGNYHRMQKALELLQTTETPISEIASLVGYDYQASFTSAVKHFFGVTPRQLRVRAQRN